VTAGGAAAEGGAASLFVGGLCVCVKLRQELEKVRRRLEMELSDVREQLAERTSQLHDVQAQLNRREQELQTALNRSVPSKDLLFSALDSGSVLASAYSRCGTLLAYTVVT